MSNSNLVEHVHISNNRGNYMMVDGKEKQVYGRLAKIDTITIHCVVGQCSIESLGAFFSSPSKKGASNYGIGTDGRVGMYVEEKDRAWTSSSSSNDNRAVTIECASDLTPPYAINDKVYATLIKLCADICKRNGIKELKWKGDKNLIGKIDQQNITVHRWFASTACPGDYIYNRLGQIANEVNILLKQPEENKTTLSSNSKWPLTPFVVRVNKSGLEYRMKPSINWAVKGTTGSGAFTIIDISGDWGKLKSGAGWIDLTDDACTVIGVTKESPKKTLNEIAKEVINGKWGVGEDRKNRLTQAGYDYKAVQEKVDKLMRG